MKLHDFYKLNWRGEPSIVVAHGDGFHSAEVIQRAKAALEECLDGALFEKLESPSGLGEALDLYFTHGLWGEQRVVELQLDKVVAGASGDQERLFQAAQRENVGNVLLIRCPLLPSSQWLNSLGESACVVHCGGTKVDKRDLRSWLIAAAEERGLALSYSGAVEMNSRLGDQAGVLENALTLMELSSQKVVQWGELQVREFFTKDTQSKVFDLADALAGQDLNRSLAIMTSIFDRGTMVVELMGGLRMQFRRLLLLKQNQGKWARSELPKRLGIPPYFLEKTMRQAERFNLPHLRRVYNELYQLDWKSKHSSAGDRDLFEMFILKLFFGS